MVMLINILVISFFIGVNILLVASIFKEFIARKKRLYISTTLWLVTNLYLLILVSFFFNWLYPLEGVEDGTFFKDFLVKIILLFFLFFIMMLFYCIKQDKSLNYKIPFEVILFLTFSVQGILLLILNCNSFIMLYLNTELLSISSVILSFNLKAGLSGSLIYYVLSAIGSGCLLFGVGFIYFITGIESFPELCMFLHNSLSTLEPWKLNMLHIGYILFVSGIFIKIGSVAPFHLWIQEVYKSANTFVVSFFASIPILGLFGILLNLNVALGPQFVNGLEYYYVGLSICSVLIGTFGAMNQDNLKRIFVYSSISNIGFIICLFPNVTWESYGVIIFFIIIYCFNSFCFWSLLTVFELCLNVKINNFKDLSTLYHSGRYAKSYCIFLLVFLFSSIGIPPLSGFFGKYFLFLNLVEQGHYGLLCFFIIMSCLSAYYFLRVVITIVLPRGKEEGFFCRDAPDNLDVGFIFATMFHIGFFFVMSILMTNSILAGLSLFFFYMV